MSVLAATRSGAAIMQDNSIRDKKLFDGSPVIHFFLLFREKSFPTKAPPQPIAQRSY